MARDFNQNRNTNAHLGTVDTPIKKQGTFYAQSYGFDGLSYVKVDFPDFVKDFIQGNTNTTEYFIPNNVTSIRPYAFSGFPNLDNLTILNETRFVTIDTNALNGTKIGNKEQGSVIYVVNAYYDDYVSDYGSLYNFASFESETWYVINYEKVGTATLTKQLLNNLNIPLTFSGLVIASDINYVTSISVSELESITQIWLKGCNDLVFDLDELPNGWVYDHGTLYVSPTDYDTFVANHSGYENYISKEYSLTISGSGTLTSVIVENAIEDLALTEVPVGVVNKVVVPVGFTAIDNGSLNGLYQYTSIEKLDIVNTDILIDGGWSNVTTKLGEDFANNLKELTCSLSFTYGSWFYELDRIPTTSKLETIICRKISNSFNATNHFRNSFENRPKQLLAYDSSVKINFNMVFFNSRVELFGSFDVSSLNSINLDGATHMKSILAHGWLKSFDITATSLDHDALVVLLNNLGTPTTQQTLTMGATKLALLSVEEQAIATAKNWQLA